MSRITKPYEIHEEDVISYVADKSKYPYLMGYEQMQADMDAINKLGHIEDFEEKLKIEIDILAEVFKEGFYYNDGDAYGYCKPENISISFDGELYYIEDRRQEVCRRLDMYGMTWCLKRKLVN